MRSRIEVYWNNIETAPAGVAVQVRVTDGSSDEYVAVSVQAYAGRMGQRRHRLAVGGATHVLEALRGNPPSQVEA